MLYRYADGWASGTAELDGFEDAASISSWAAEAMAWAVGNGIIDGVSEGVLAPQDTATRAQVAAMLNASSKRADLICMSRPEFSGRLPLDKVSLQL